MLRTLEIKNSTLLDTSLEPKLARSGCQELFTHVYHISYTPETKEVSLFFWGCNFACKGCLSKKEVGNYLLKENLHRFGEEPGTNADSPNRFLSVSDVLTILERLEIKTVLFEGQEASLDPSMPILAKTLHEKFGTYNILCTNAYRLPSLDEIDGIQMSIKSITDSIHVDYTGKSNTRVLNNFINLCHSDIRLSVATVLIPDYIDVNEIERVAKFIACVKPDVPYNILPYFKAGDNPWNRPTPETMAEAESIAKKHLNRVHAWRGDEELKYEVVRVY